MTYNKTRHDATTSKRKREVDVNGNSNLKKTRERARKSNYNRVVHKANPPPDENYSDSEDEKQLSNMEKRLTSCKSLLRSLPNNLQSYMLDWARKLTSHVLTKIHLEKRETYMITNPNFLPKSIRFDFKLTSQLDLEGNKEMVVLCAKATMVMDEAKEKLRSIIREAQKLEVLATTEKLQTEFIKGLTGLFTYVTCYIRNKGQILEIPEKDTDGTDAITEYFIHHFLQTVEGKKYERTYGNKS